MSRSECGVCGGEIAFDSEFSGVETACPLCESSTVLIPKGAITFRRSLPMLRRISLGLSPTAILILAVGLFYNPEWDPQELIVGRIGGLALGIIAESVMALYLLFLLVVWLLVPWGGSRQVE
jgi:hypothetical protein